MKRLKILWNKFKALKWWQKALLFLPLVVGIVLLVLFMFVPKSDSKKFEGTVKHHRDYVDRQIEKREKTDKLLEKRDKQLVETQKGLQEEIEAHEQEAAKTVNRINAAVAANNTSELERIRSELNVTSQRRAKPQDTTTRPRDA